MKKRFVWMVLVCAMVVFGAGMSIAGNGNGAGNGAGNGTGPIHDILSGVPFEFTGVVAGFEQGGGLTLDIVGEEDVVLYGIGPVRYWTSQGVAHPTIGEELTANGFTVDYNDTFRNIVMSITIGEETIQLRDKETGLPLWRGGNGASAGSASGNSYRNKIGVRQ